MIKTNLHYGESDDALTIERVQDVEPILNANKAQFNASDKSFKSETFNHVARIPTVLAELWCKKRGISFSTFIEDPAILRTFLNDPENKFLRTKPGKI